MNINYFSQVRILDGGMGQLLLSKGLKAKGTLWSASALIDENYHKLLVDTHLDFIKSGADVITTNSFSTRRERLIENNSEKYFKYANEKAGELAVKAKKISNKNILIAGSLPSQKGTYVVDKRDEDLIEKDFFAQAKLIKPFIDFFYLDVISSSKEVGLCLKAVGKLDLPVLVGLHISKNGKLPSNESITETVEKHKNKNWLGVILACVSPEIIEDTIDEMTKLNLPFGFKANLWKKDPLPAHEIQKINKNYSVNVGINPNEVLGKRDDFTPENFYDFSNKMKSKGVTIIGGCCETKPSHISAISKLKQN